MLPRYLVVLPAYVLVQFSLAILQPEMLNKSCWSPRPASIVTGTEDAGLS
jgi:hypothetical protein